jgi:hypothetical protein
VVCLKSSLNGAKKTNKTEDTNKFKTCAFHDALQAGKQKDVHCIPLIWRPQADVRQSNNVWQRFCDRFLRRPLLTLSRSFMNVANSVLWRMAIILKANEVNLLVSSVLFVFWYHSPNFLDTPRSCPYRLTDLHDTLDAECFLYQTFGDSPLPRRALCEITANGYVLFEGLILTRALLSGRSL